MKNRPSKLSVVENKQKRLKRVSFIHEEKTKRNPDTRQTFRCVRQSEQHKLISMMGKTIGKTKQDKRLSSNFYMRNKEILMIYFVNRDRIV